MSSTVELLVAVCPKDRTSSPGASDVHVHVHIDDVAVLAIFEKYPAEPLKVYVALTYDVFSSFDNVEKTR